MRDKACEKLKSKSGASLVLVLVLFLLCAMISSVVVMAAASGAGRSAHRERQQQGYLSLTSAAELLAAEMKDAGSFVAVETTDDYACNETLTQRLSRKYTNGQLLDAGGVHADADKVRSANTDSLKGTLQGILGYAGSQIYVKRAPSYSSTFTIHADDAAGRFADVYAVFEMDADYHIRLTLKLTPDETGRDDGAQSVASAYAMTLYFTAAQTPSTSQSTITCRHEISYTQVQVNGSKDHTVIANVDLEGEKTVNQTAVSWSLSKVSKGG